MKKMSYQIRGGCLNLAAFMALLVVIFASLTAEANKPTYADCMKNPFATGCRGISAKRSQLEPLVGGLMEPQVVNGGRQSPLWLGEAARQQVNYRPVDLPARQWPAGQASESGARYEQEPVALELYQIFNLAEPASVSAGSNQKGGPSGSHRAATD